MNKSPTTLLNVELCRRISTASEKGTHVQIFFWLQWMIGAWQKTQSSTLLLLLLTWVRLSTAYDMICCCRLCKAMVLGEQCWSGSTTYLTDRQQCIMLQNPPLTINCSKGVPQGSVLGPLLFNLYVSDLGRIAKKLKASLPSFADDFTLYASRATPAAACRVISEALTKLKDALEDRGLVISCEKTVAMLIPPNPYLTASFVNCTITWGDTDVKFVHQIRLLFFMLTVLSVGVLKLTTFAAKLGARLERYADPLPTYTICSQKVPSLSHSTWPWIRCLCVCSVNECQTLKSLGSCLA